MNTLPTYLPTYLTLVSSVYLCHTRNLSFFHCVLFAFCFPIATALIIVTYSITCLARQAWVPLFDKTLLIAIPPCTLYYQRDIK